jgi:integrase
VAKSIRSKAARAKLHAQDAPYYEPISKGCALGFRKTVKGAETWIARFRDRQGKQHWQPLGTLDDYDDAKRAAEAWFAKMGGSASTAPRRGTVGDAIRLYLADLRDGGRIDAARDAEQKFKACGLTRELESDQISMMLVEATTKDDWKAYRKRLMTDRAPQTVNRYMRQIAAALNYAIENGHVGNPAAWTLPALATDSAEDSDTAAAVFLSPLQRAHLAKHLSKAAQQYVAVLYASGARPSEIAKARVKHYDARRHTLSLWMRKGRPVKWVERVVELDPADKPLFVAAIKDKLPEAWLVVNVKGEQWTRAQWGREIRAAIEYANASGNKPEELIPLEASAYSYRHARISELLQVFHVDALTVANQTGTSLAMMKLYYWKFIPSAIREKFERHSVSVQ